MIIISLSWPAVLAWLQAIHSVRVVFACMLHMHQPLLPAGGQELKIAKIISNLDLMMKNQNIRKSWVRGYEILFGSMEQVSCEI